MPAHDPSDDARLQSRPRAAPEGEIRRGGSAGDGLIRLVIQMLGGILITKVKLLPSSPEARSRGLLGWVSFNLLGMIGISGIKLRRTRGGRHTLSYPCHRDHAQRVHELVWPLTEEARIMIEDLVFRALEIARDST